MRINASSAIGLALAEGLWDWWFLIENHALPWSHRFYERFAENLDSAKVTDIYNGNIRKLNREQVIRLLEMLQQPPTSKNKDGTDIPEREILKSYTETELADREREHHQRAEAELKDKRGNRPRRRLILQSANKCR